MYRKFGILWHLAISLWLCLSGNILSTAQDDFPNLPITLGETQVITLNGETPTIFEYQSGGNEVVTIIVHSLHTLADGEMEAARDTVVDVLAPSGKRLAYNDNHYNYTGREDLLPTDAVLEKLLLSEPGVYLIRVNTYGGIFATEVEVTLHPADLFDAVVTEEDRQVIIQGALPRFRGYAYTFEASAGDVLTITGRDLSHTLDPILRLEDANGELIIMNDDHGGYDLTLDTLDSKITAFEIPVDGTYTIRLSDFLGRAGRFELVISTNP